MHETQLILYDGAERMLQKMELNPKFVTPSEIRADYEAMQARKSSLERTYKSAEKDVKALQQKLSNITQYMGKEITVNKEQSPQQQNITHNNDIT
ncbi:MAG: hypothetical protein K6F86_06425 [Lachnospiraceae bacterium]|nr:hypothetical protein [Lachnospiraceae bacterium]